MLDNIYIIIGIIILVLLISLILFQLDYHGSDGSRPKNTTRGGAFLL